MILKFTKIAIARLATISFFLSLIFFQAADGQIYTFPLKISENNRYLVDQKNKPFFWTGDAAWSLIAQLNKEDAVYYLENRRQKGFNVVMVNLIEHHFSTDSPRNINGDAPFTGKAFISPNEAYFAHSDAIIREAQKRGMIVLLFPLYLGYQCGNEGWCKEVKKASLSDMRTWGQYVGNRYRNFNNIVWCIGGDTDPLPVKDKVLEFVRGIREVDSIHLLTAHNQPESFAVTPWPAEGWLNINNVYSYSSTLYVKCKNAFERKPEMPYFMLESAYENEQQSSQQRLRSQAYWPVLCGGMGYIFGNCPIWHFGASSNWCGLTDWKPQLDSPGSLDMMHLQRLFLSREWYSLVPDFDHKVMISGSGIWGQMDYATAALTKNGNTMIAYLPSQRSVLIDMRKISGTESNAWWYEPSVGTPTLIGTYLNSGYRKFTPPRNGDWVLVIDDNSVNLPVPGGRGIRRGLSNISLLLFDEETSNGRPNSP